MPTIDLPGGLEIATLYRLLAEPAAARLGLRIRAGKLKRLLLRRLSLTRRGAR